MRVQTPLRQSILAVGWRPSLRSAKPYANCSRAASTAANQKLDLLAVDRKWKDKWARDPSLQLAKNHGAEKAYILSMFPYPSGSLHMGHVRVYTISDVLARYKHMKGYDVLHPMGWDAFGLPAENAAIERGINPAEWTEKNIADMKEQLKAIGAHFDWERELMTCSPDFYKHTQRIFLMLHEKGLAYQKKALVNYDPVEETVLANEQVDANGYSWRSGAKVEKLELKQWFFRITAFKEALLEDLELLKDGWPERVLTMQRHWLGKSMGARIKFKTNGPISRKDIEVFTTRPDTLHAVQYLALSMTHPIVLELADRDNALKEFLESTDDSCPDSKVGFRLDGVEAFNPVRLLETNPHIPKSLPVFVAPYVLGDYGEGAVMGVPGHDSRDFAFWKANTSSPISSAVEPKPSGASAEACFNMPESDEKPYCGEGTLTNLCGSYSGLPSEEGGRKIVSDLKKEGNHAEFDENWRLRDWLISRQRYWGTPIPIIHCKGCGPVPVPTEQLPVQLPVLDGLKGRQGNPLESAEDWLNVSCPSCGGPAKRDTDTMDTFVDSSWYFLRFLDSKNESTPFSPSVAQPVDTYVGGVEHAILHLLYARFIYKFLATSDLFPQGPSEQAKGHEPFRTLLSQGMVHGKTYSDPSTGRFLRPSELDFSNPNKPLIKDTQTAPNVSYEKMSKSKYNGVDPSTCINSYGADATRAHILFSAPVSEVLEWDESKIVGIQRWFNRVWKVTMDTQKSLADAFSLSADDLKSARSPALPPLDKLSNEEADVLLAAHSAIESVSHCLEKVPYGLNTVISDLTKFTNTLASSLPQTATSPPSQAILYIAVSTLLRLLAPIAPAFTSECWEQLHTGVFKDTNPLEIPSIFSSPWPSAILTATEAQTLRSRGGKVVAVQINGKLRFTTTIPRPSEAESTGSGTPAEFAAKQQDFILSSILETDEGKLWLRKKHDWEKRKKVVVVKGGKVVSVVF